MDISLAAVEHYIPPNIVTSEELDRRFNCPLGQHERHSGVKQRAYGYDEPSVEMGYKAALKALDQAGLSIEDIDLIIGACATKYQQIPNNASIILSYFNTKKKIPAIDIDTACSSHLVALNAASLYIHGNQYRTILIVSAESAHIALDKNDIKVNALFGDGAAATVVTKATSDNITSKILGYDLITLSNHYSLCEIQGGGSGKNFVTDPDGITKHHLFSMDGKKLFKLTLKELPVFVDRLCEKSGISKNEIDLVVPHQASKQANQLMFEKLGFSDDIVLSIIETHGNQVSVSIPTCFSIGLAENKIQRGMKLLLLGSAAGVSFGGMILEY